MIGGQRTHKGKAAHLLIRAMAPSTITGTIATITGTIAESVQLIDASFEPMPDGVIDATGVTLDGQTIDLWIANDGAGPLIWPGASFLPYGGVYYNPLLASIRATDD